MMKAPGSWSFRSAMAGRGVEEERRGNKEVMALAFLKSHQASQTSFFLR